MGWQKRINSVQLYKEKENSINYGLGQEPYVGKSQEQIIDMIQKERRRLTLPQEVAEVETLVNIYKGTFFFRNGAFNLLGF